ncbi:spore germination protein [Microaerobacter geothermalis]|uniref:GerAB/ArcD/ProY family transporter n=1 Tax=Microaerobacter geothermalis TaxID=674972 RepID=UPI001F48A840|nr:endospore germination permease [Microaerobacter geothermalis]MCF6094469.1 spore germination protein [Microaerobacter geothermalis]
MEDRISGSQLALIVLGVIVGVGILNLPRTVTETAKTDGWIAVIIGGMISILAVLLISLLTTRFPGKSMVEFVNLLLGKWIGSILILGYVLYFFVFAGVVARQFVEVVKLFLLPKTPIEVLIIAMLLTCAYPVLHGINIIARLNEFIMPLALFFLLFVFVFLFRDAKWDNLLPFLGEGWLPIIEGVPNTFFSYLGFEVILFMIPYMEQPRDAGKMASTGVAVSMVLYLVIVVFAIATFGAEDLQQLMYPTLSMVQYIMVPGAFIERFESVLMSVWIPLAFTTINVLFFTGSLAMNKLTGMNDHRIYVILALPVIYISSLIPNNVAEISDFMEIFSYYGSILALGVPLLLWGIAWIRKKRG